MQKNFRFNQRFTVNIKHFYIYNFPIFKFLFYFILLLFFSEWPVKLDEELKIQEEKHILERENLENQLKEKRYNFE